MTELMIRSARWVGAAVALGSLLSPAVANGAETLGSALAGPADAGPVDCDQRCTFVQTQLTGARLSPPPGVVVRWRIRAATSEPVRLRIVNGTTVKASSAEFVPTGGGAVDTIPARLPIGPGDRLALDQDGSQALHALPADSGARLAAYDPALPDPPGAGTSAGQTLEDLELLVNADVERDRDGDGFGDETQDACPSDAATTGLCPADLSARVRWSGPLPAVGYDTTFSVSVEGVSGLRPPPGIKLEVTLPGGGAQPMSFRISGSGACTLATALTCAFGNPAPGATLLGASLTLRPTAAGPLTVAATVRSDAPDPNPANDSAALTLNVLAMGACANTATGTAAADRLEGTTFGDRLIGRGGDDLLLGGNRDDCLLGGPGDDRLRGEAGNDVLRGGRGVDRLDGGSGRDRLDSRDGRREIVRCGTGRDRVRADRRDRLLGCERKRLG